MKKNIEVILASAVGLFAMVGVMAVRKIIKNKTYHTDYSDSHRLFNKGKLVPIAEHGDGIEINSML